jgi:N4-gp56 family major capsid protein
MALTEYGDISPRTAAYAAKELLERAIPYMVIEKFANVEPLPERSSKVIKFRRYNPLPPATTPLTEGVTPASTKLTFTDITATLNQYGSLIEITDVVEDTHEDPVLKEAVKILSEQAAVTIETMRYNIIKAGTSVIYAGGATSRSEVVGTLGSTEVRRATRFLKAQNARPITEIVRSTAAYGTQNIAPSYIAICHPDLEADLRQISTYIPAEKYGTISPWENEIGACEGVRFLTSTIFEPWRGAGSTTTTGKLATSGRCDVYPVIVFGKDAFGIVPFKGKTAVTPTVINTVPSKSDPLGQRGSAGWKTMQTAVILQDLYMVRLEVAVSA